MEQKKNIHAGHRERLKVRINSLDMTELDDLYFLEHLLTYTIPRADTNIIAHRLLEEYKTIDNIFEATETSLQEIEGVGPRTACFLKYMQTVCYKYNKARATKKAYVGTYAELTSYLRGILPHCHNEQMVFMCLNKAMEVKNYKIIKGNNNSAININTEELISYLIKNKAANCIVAHTHPSGVASPSESDINSFIRLRKLLGDLSVDLIDSIILGKTQYYSTKMQQLREYDIIDNISQIKLNKLPMGY